MTKFAARIVAAAAIVLAAAPIAMTSAQAETLTRRIAVADLDLSSAQDIARFDARIARVASEICPIETRQNQAKADACRDQIRSQAMTALGGAQRLQLAQAQRAGFNLAAK